MKKFIILSALFIVCTMPVSLKAQSYELQQLILNLEKLDQFRAILDQMQKGYQVIAKGYSAVKDLTEGNFSLHKIFLDKLLEVNPTVKQYKKIKDIITFQKNLIKEFSAGKTYFKKLDVFNSIELEYLESVYQNLISESINNLDELIMVVTARRLRMSDAERLNAIDKIYQEMEDKINFLRQFTDQAILMAKQRAHEMEETRALKKWYFGPEGD
ncbi:MAG: TerB family tellurite resistance protein [Sphingobacteriales bacterium]|nr:TerB family tellurite resistance protein [Sphingobacteriales bacterium]OJW00266.1 MAG: hypothetical protein BGO52_04035 [Sphingobacteriales bacterium 44-61]